MFSLAEICLIYNCHFMFNTFDFPVQRNVCYQNDIFQTFFSSLFNSYLLRVYFFIEIILQSILRLFIMEQNVYKNV